MCHRLKSRAPRKLARVLSDRTSLSNCANAARTPFISFPVEVSSIGSVAERNEIPSDFRLRAQREVASSRRQMSAIEHTAR
jgi:hypothetical protein